jgi:hypothetical protein
VADIFVSYTASDKTWAFWIAQELEALGHKHHIHEWEIDGGGNIVAWMEKRLDEADHVLCVISSAYLNAPYSIWELRAAQWAAASEKPNFALPVFIESCEPPKLLALINRCDLHGLCEADARERLAAFLAPAKKPAGPMRFPAKTKPMSFPGGVNAPQKGAQPSRQPRNLPFISLGPLFVGRDKVLDDLRATLVASKGALVALYGLGGVGKTRLAIEYALRREADYSALLFVPADAPSTLDASLAALAGAEVLDLDERDAPQDPTKIEAVLRWLVDHPTWLMILDNVDDREAVKAVTKLMPRLIGGDVIVTARAANFPAGARLLELEVLNEDAATKFLLERTRGLRAPGNDDAASARELARELGRLALGLEQAGAHIATERIGFADYLKLWSESREKALGGSDSALMDSERTLATTWTTSVDRLSPESRRLIDRLAMLAPDPVPDSLLDVQVPGEAAKYDAHKARADLYAYSLITRAIGEHGTGQGFVVHRLVQDSARRAMPEQRRREALREALAWVNAAFVGDPEDTRSWPVLEPLAPHALAVARRADVVGITEPTGRLLSMLERFARKKEFQQYLHDLRDRQDARDERTKLAEDQSPLAWVVPIIMLSLVLLILYLLKMMPALEPGNKDVFNVALGALVTAFTTVVVYYMWSSNRRS